MKTDIVLERIDKTDNRGIALSLFKGFLERENTHLTYERRLLFDEIYSMPGAFCAEDVIEKCSPDGKYISRGTIYKTINLMEDSGIIRRIPKRAKRRYYMFLHPGWNKADLICIKCGSRETIDFEEILKIGELLGDKKNFLPTSITVTLNGICSSCR